MEVESVIYAMQLGKLNYAQNHYYYSIFLIFKIFGSRNEKFKIGLKKHSAFFHLLLLYGTNIVKYRY